MDWKVLATTLATLFLAEMGDKTQLAVITMTASTKKPWAVFLGASLAMTIVTAFGVLAGGFVTRFVPEEVLKKVAALLFIAIGIWTWVKG